MSKIRAKKSKRQAELKQHIAKSHSSKKLIWLFPLIVFCWPFLYLHSLVFASNGYYLAISNDFINLYYKYKIYLLDNFANFNFPLWSPAEAAGYPFYSSPFAQAFYPLNIPLTLLYKILGGYTPFDHQIFTVFGIAIFALGLFAWLRLINSNIRAVIFATIVMSISFKVTEIMRFPNAVHTAAWYPWILYGLTRIVFNRSKKDAVISGALLCVFLICLCTGGYPYYVYYSVFLFAPYLSAFLIRPLRSRLFGQQPIYWKRAIITLLLAAFAAGLICTPYILAIKDLLSQTTDRGGKDYNYSVEHTFGIQDTIGSLVYPPVTMVEGMYFFSITALLIIILYLFGKTTNTTNSENPQTNTALPSGHGNLYIKIFFLVWIGLISYISYGSRSYLFGLLWHYMPGFSSLRAWPRLNIILVPILAWLLSLAYNSFEATVSDANIRNKVREKWKKWLPLGIIIFVYGIIFAVQFYFYSNKICNPYNVSHFTNVLLNNSWFLVYGAVAFAAVFLVLTISLVKPFASNATLYIVLIGFICVAALEMRPVGARMWTSRTVPAQEHFRLDVMKLNEASFAYRRTDNNGTIALGPNFSAGIMDNWYFNRYVSFFKKTENELAVRRFLLGGQDGRKIFFSQAIEYPTIQAFLQDAMRYPQTGQMLSYTGDELQWEINTPLAGYLSFIDNWDPNWKGFVDDDPVEIKLLFGTFKSVHIPAGFHRVRFSYCLSIFKR